MNENYQRMGFNRETLSKIAIGNLFNAVILAKILDFNINVINNDAIKNVVEKFIEGISDDNNIEGAEIYTIDGQNSIPLQKFLYKTGNDN